MGRSVELLSHAAPPDGISGEAAAAKQVESSLPHIVIPLLKGAIYSEHKPELWSALLALRPQIENYLSVLGLSLFIDESEGFAFVRQIDPGSGEDGLPRLIQRRPLGFGVSVLCLLLRQWLVENDAQGAQKRTIVEKKRIRDELALFLPKERSEKRIVDKIETCIKQTIELGLVKELKTNKEKVEILRITKALINADWLGDLQVKLQEYREHAGLSGKDVWND